MFTDLFVFCTWHFKKIYFVLQIIFKNNQAVHLKVSKISVAINNTTKLINQKAGLLQNYESFSKCKTSLGIQNDTNVCTRSFSSYSEYK